MSVILIEPHYLGSLEYFSLLVQYEKICFEINDSFPKQTFRNRAYFLTSNKVQPLIIPVKYNNGDLTREVKVDYSQRWMKDHWGAFYSSYGKAPFFEYFGDDLKNIWDKEIPDLLDLNIELMKLIFKILQIDFNHSFTTDFVPNIKNGDMDFRGIVNPKKSFSNRKIYNPHPYRQLFGDTFVPNLSIVDLIMNEGPNAAHILSKSKS
ncbi:WbqC family protein [Ekhidna sp.]|uniref:WbqC family protein n=1 Tax=Ekhidna sp. TaxID=2608089 RepID=UPI00329886D2